MILPFVQLWKAPVAIKANCFQSFAWLRCWCRQFWESFHFSQQMLPTLLFSLDLWQLNCCDIESSVWRWRMKWPANKNEENKKIKQRICQPFALSFINCAEVNLWHIISQNCQDQFSHAMLLYFHLEGFNFRDLKRKRPQILFTWKNIYFI